MEQIIDVAPQVIVMSAYASCDADELSGKTGIPVFVVPGSDTTLDDAAYETIRLLGELYGLETRAQELTKYLKASRPTSTRARPRLQTIRSRPSMSAVCPSRGSTALRARSRLRPVRTHPRQKPRRHDRADRRVQHRH